MLLLLLAHGHSHGQEWYTQEYFGPEQVQVLEKRQAENRANDPNYFYSTHGYEANIHQKRDVDTDKDEQSSDVAETTSHGVTDHVSLGNDRNGAGQNYQSSDGEGSLETNMTIAESNRTYEAGGWYGNDVSNQTMNDGINVNETSNNLLDDVVESRDVMDERDETLKTKKDVDDTMQESTHKRTSGEDGRNKSESMSIMEDNKRRKQGNETEAEDVEDISKEQEGSGYFPKESFLSDSEEDEQPVKRQNSGKEIGRPVFLRLFEITVRIHFNSNSALVET